MKFSKLYETEETLRFAAEYFMEDSDKLIFSAEKYPSIDIKLAVTIIEARKKLLLKVPEWAEREDLIYTGGVSIEQASSYLAAKYKQRFATGKFIADLTGGQGIDSYYLSQKADRLVYVEKESNLYEAAVHNFKKLKADNIFPFHFKIDPENAAAYLDDILYRFQMKRFDLIYLDPSRRKNGKRTYAIGDYEPDIYSLKDTLFNYTNRLLLKISPMTDIKAAIKELSNVVSADIISVDNECKELLLMLGKGSRIPYNKIEIKAVNISGSSIESLFMFTFEEEEIAMPIIAEKVLRYLYEANSSIMKGGAFKLVGNIFGLEKISRNTHLYTSDQYNGKFPGKIYEVIEVSDYNNYLVRNLHKTYPKANISVRNFQQSPADLKKILKIKDGGDIQIIGITCADGTKKIAVCSRLNHAQTDQHSPVKL